VGKTTVHMFEKPAFQKIRPKKTKVKTIGGKTITVPPKETQLVMDFYHEQLTFFSH
jgi:hypothetical protein